MSKKIKVYQFEWNYVTLVHYRVVGFDYETQRYKVRCKFDKTVEHWIDADIIDAIDYFKEDAAYYNTNEMMARKAEQKRLFMALQNPQPQSEEEQEGSKGTGKIKTKFKPF